MALPLLSGIRVLDLSQYLPGPYCAQMLADLGAEVVKVEPPAGDPLRRFDPPDADGLAACYKLLNAGKRVILLDLKAAADQETLSRLLQKADVLVESFRPGTLDRLGFPRHRLQALRPDLVHVAISGWGQSGPYRLRAGHDLTYMALGGGLIASGTAATPLMSYPPVADHGSAVQGVAAVCAALFARSRGAGGAYLDISLMETVLGWQSMALTLARRGQAPRRGDDLLTGGAAYYNLYRCACGGFAVLAPIEEKFWRAFCLAVGRPEWVARQHEPLPQEALKADVAVLFGSRSLAQWQTVLDPVDCCFEAVPELAALAQHPHIQARGQVVEHPGEEPLLETRLGLRLNGGAPPARMPLREADWREVLADWAE